MESKICLALDGFGGQAAVALVNTPGQRCYAVKIHDLYDEYGPVILMDLRAAGARRIWVDAKLHDTPDTVARRMQALVGNGADIVTVHASGGVPMMRKAVQSARDENPDAEVWAISVLTSLDREEVQRIYHEAPDLQVFELASMAREAGVQGIVCSALEVATLSRSPALAGMQFVVPGTRSAGVALGQQKRSGTPRQAVDDGATLLVAGSQVTKAEDPVAAFDAMEAEIR